MMKGSSRMACLALLLLALACGGCARHMSVADLESGGGDIGVRVVSATGETVEGRLLFWDDEAIAVRVTDRPTGEVTDRRFPLDEVASATVHRTRGESMWGPFVSTIVGVAGGLLAAAAVRGAGQ